MNDRHLDPPEYDEAPEWYSLIETAIEESPPASIAAALQKILDDWADEYNATQQPDEPDYSDADWQNHYSFKLRNPSQQEIEDREYAADLAFDAAREKR